MAARNGSSTQAARAVAVKIVGVPSPKGFTVVSMFSGCGGMDVGFLGGFESGGKVYNRLPFKIVWANDLSQAACYTYERNTRHEIHCGDVWKQLGTLPRTADLVIGGFPCQDVSVNGKRKGIEGKRTGLYKAMVEVVDRVQPKAFVAENVKGLLSDEKRPLLKIVDDFVQLGYDVTWRLYLAADYGVPQMRQRIFIVGTSKKAKVKPFVHPEPTLKKEEWVTAKQAIGDLEDKAESWETSHIWSRAESSPEQGCRKLKPNRPSATIRAECHGNIQFHYAKSRRLSMREAARIQSFPDKFIFASKLRETERQVGNAVPPVMGWHIARAVSACLR